MILFMLSAVTMFAQDDMLEMPEPQTVEIEGLAINYYEAGEGDTTVFLVHGNSSSARSFIHQIADLSEDYRVIAMDLPGHGLSDRAIEPATTYNFPGYARIIVSVAEELDAMDAVFVGWSLGGHNILEAVPNLPDAPGFFIFGTPPIAFPPGETAFLPTEEFLALIPEFTEEQTETYIRLLFAPDFIGEDDPLPSDFVEDVELTDGTARGELGASLAPDGYADEVVIVAEMTQPLAIIHGAEEQLINLEYIVELDMPTLWRDEVQVIEEAGHSPHYETPDEFTELLVAFIEDITEMDS